MTQNWFNQTGGIAEKIKNIKETIERDHNLLLCNIVFKLQVYTYIRINYVNRGAKLGNDQWENIRFT